MLTDFVWISLSTLGEKSQEVPLRLVINVSGMVLCGTYVLVLERKIEKDSAKMTNGATTTSITILETDVMLVGKFHLTEVIGIGCRTKQTDKLGKS